MFSDVRNTVKKMGGTETDAAIIGAGLAVAGGAIAGTAAMLTGAAKNNNNNNNNNNRNNSNNNNSFHNIMGGDTVGPSMTKTVPTGPPTCWFGCPAPLQKSCITETSKIVLFPFASIAWLLGGLARIADNTVMCVCWPCFFDFVVYEGTSEEELAKYPHNCKVQCYKCWKVGRRMNGDFNGMETCFMPGMAPTCCMKQAPQYGEDVEGHCLDAPNQVCLMDIHRMG